MKHFTLTFVLFIITQVIFSQETINFENISMDGKDFKKQIVFTFSGFDTNLAKIDISWNNEIYLELDAVSLLNEKGDNLNDIFVSVVDASGKEYVLFFSRQVRYASLTELNTHRIVEFY